MSRVLSLSLILALSCLPLLAQENVGTVTGAVRDESGGVVPGADISITNVGTGISTDTITSDAGIYAFNSVAIGEYRLTATMPGFRTLEQSGLRVVSGEVLTIDVTLSVGDVAETVEVMATLPTIEKQSNKAGYARVNEEIARLPIAVSNNNRQALSFLRTMPGVNYNPNDSNENNAMSTAFIHGTPNASPSYTIDGVRAGSSTHQNSRDDTAPIPEMVQEFRLDTNTNAEHGWDSGVAITLIFKSGTNELHGDAFWYFRNDILDARPWRAPSKSVNRQNDYGFVLGGPIWKNRTFFFGGFDGYKLRTAPGDSVQTVPTAAMRNGDFSEILGPQIGTDALGRPIHQGAIYDPMTTRSDGQGGFIRDPFPNNMIPADRFSTVTKNLISRFGLPNRPGVNNNWVGGLTSTPVDKTSYYLKVDHQLDEAGDHRLTVGWEQSWKASRSNYPSVQDESISSLHRNDEVQYRYRFNYHYTIRPNVLFNLRTGVTRTPRVIGTQGLANDNTGAEVGIKGVPGPIAPQVGVQGQSAYGPIFQKLIDPSQTIPANMDVTWVKGSHNFKVGAAYLLSVSKQNLALFDQGSFSFSALETGLPGNANTGFGFASQLLGEVDSAFVWSQRDFRHNGGAWGIYFQDSWRATSKLTINYGLRNDVFVPLGETYDRIGAFNPTIPNPGAGGLPGSLWFWGDGPGRNGFKRVADTLWSQWGPRLGFAYSPDDNTVIRASGAYMYFPLFGAMTSGFNTPFLGWTLDPSVRSLDGGLTPAFNWDNGYPDPIPDLPVLEPDFANGQAMQYLNRDDFKAGRTLTLNFGLERDLGWGLAIRANYHGKFSHNLPSHEAVRMNQLSVANLSLGNTLLAPVGSDQAMAAGIAAPYPGFGGPVAQAFRPFPHFLDIQQRAAPVSDLNYHALVLSLQKRYGHGLSFMLNHTISKALGNVGFSQQGHGFAPIQHTSQRHLRYHYQHDRPQNLSLSWLYELPFGPGKRLFNGGNLFSKYVLSGWTLGVQHNYFSGQPISVSSRVRYPGGFGPIWPVLRLNSQIKTNTICGEYSPGGRFLNVNAFMNAAPWTLGNTRTLPKERGCSYFNENATLQKDTQVNEDVNVRLGVDFFNVFNRHIWGGLNTDTGNAAGFGQFGSTSRPRFIQLHLSIHF